MRARGLVRRFGEREALRGVDLDVAPGEVVAVLGPNGAGKTTLLSVLAGLQAPDAGTVSRGPREVGWVPQQAAVYGRLSVRENLELFARLERAGDGAVDRVLALTDLAERAGDVVATLSGGMRQRLNLAVGLLPDPPVLLLDEPTAALDPGQRRRLWDVLRGLAAGGTGLLLTTHDVAEAQREASRVVVLVDGTVRHDGPPAGADLEALL
jgi:ABC-2 type transport system ATP-binding protein